MTLATPVAAALLPAASGIDPASCARGLYIGGEWLWPAGRASIPVIDPATEQLLAEVPDASVEDAIAAVEALSRHLMTQTKRSPLGKYERLDLDPKPSEQML